jgi:AcrR family transcriptional regulator
MVYKMESETKRGKKRSMFRKKILASAEELFLQKRYSAITIDEIAKGAGLTKRTIYKYFPSKLALYTSMFDHYLSELADEMYKTATMEGKSEQIVGRLWNVLHEFTKNNERFMRLYWMLDSDEFEGEMPEELLVYVKEHTINMFAAVVHANERAKKDGWMTDVDPLVLAHLMSAINKGIFIHVSKERRFSMATPTADELNNMLRTILRQGLYKRME